MKIFTTLRKAVKGVERNFVLPVSLLLLAVGGASAQSVQCPPNIDFSSGSLTNWDCFTGTCCPINTPVNSGPVANRHTITFGPGTDPYGNFPIVAPGGGLFSLKIGNSSTGAQAEKVRYAIHVPVGFNNYSFTFKYAAVLEDPGHAQAQQPRFEVIAYDSALGPALGQIICATHTYVAGVGLPGFQSSTVLSPEGLYPLYLPWSNGSLNLSGQGGKTIYVDVSSADCGQSGHFGYGYFDVLSCGQFAAAVATCNLDSNFVTLSGPAGYQSYVWYNATMTTQIGTGQTITVPAPATSQQWKLVITPYNSNGCPDTVSTPVITNFTINATPKKLCNTVGVPVQLNVTMNGGAGPMTYNWTHPTSLNNATIPNPIASPTFSGSYVVTVADTNGCFRRDTVVVQNPNFTINTPDYTTCIGTPVNINPVINPPSPAYIYNWTPGTKLSSTTIKNPVFTPTTVGSDTYIIRVDSGICIAQDTITITTLPNSFISHDTGVCQGAIFVPTVAGDPAFTYSWSPAINLSNPNVITPTITADTTRTYTITANYPTCPNIVNTLTVTVEPNPVVNLGPDQAKCKYTNLFLNASVSPTWFPNYHYQWSSPNVTDPNSPNTIFFGTADETLTFTVTTPLGCKGSDDINMQVYSGDFGTVTPQDTAVCPRNTFTMKATGGIKYLWEPGTYLSSSTDSEVVISPLTSQTYTLYVTDAKGCTDTLQTHIQVNPDALVTLPDSAVLYPDETLQMDPGGNALYFSWFPYGGLSNPNIANPVAAPAVNTRYYLTGRTEGGCVATDSIDVIVRDESLLDVPNAFTPGSAPNDQLKVVRRGAATLKYFRIFNRWGVKVFESSDINQGWNGQMNGIPQPMGVYVYEVEAYTKKGTRFHKQGNVTLIR